MTSPKEWWRRAAATMKDRRSICLAMVSASRKDLRNSDMETTIIRATSHNDRSIDHENSRRVFAWARASPSFMAPLMWTIARRAERTHSWPVALKSLLLAHGLLLVSSDSSFCNGRLPFNLSDFSDRSPSNSWGVSAFVRAYFHFLDNRAILLSMNPEDDDDDDGFGINQVEKLQNLLDLLMQIRPYADGMDNGLILEAMDCAVIEIFEVYTGVCSGVGSFLKGILGSNNSYEKSMKMKAISILRRANKQSFRLMNYFEVCKSLGVLNAIAFPPVKRIPDEDIVDLERMVNAGEIQQDEESGTEKSMKTEAKEEKMEIFLATETVITNDWVVFEDEFKSFHGYHSNPFLCSASDRTWASMVHCNGSMPWNGNLIELM